MVSTHDVTDVTPTHTYSYPLATKISRYACGSPAIAGCNMMSHQLGAGQYFVPLNENNCYLSTFHDLQKHLNTSELPLCPTN